MKLLTPTLPVHLNKLTNASLALDTEDTLHGQQIDNQSLHHKSYKHSAIADSLIDRVDFSQTSIERFDVLDCVFQTCNFTASKFVQSSWHVVTIVGARCTGMQLTNSTLKNVTFKGSKLDLLNCRFSQFENVIFEDCVMNDVDFYNSKLKNVEFLNCAVQSITFASAKMMNVDISSSTVEKVRGIDSLKGTTMSYDQLIQLAPSFAAEAGIHIK